ncbi:hypothetical protein, partial [Burkholderia cenocepacia]|uniref:hypothetical protein n=1 Tax=Burkholderia cenocepacia TaxID=95486 RepID=UPI001F4B9863
VQVLRWVACSCDREKLLWQPEFTSGPHGTARSSPFGQLLEITTGGCRSVVADGEGQLPARKGHSTGQPTSLTIKHCVWTICGHVEEMNGYLIDNPKRTLRTPNFD